MVSQVQTLLEGMGRGVTTVSALYERDVAREDLSDELVYAILHVITDGRNALDGVAAALDQQPYGKQQERSPRFPLSSKVEDFDDAMARDFPRLPVERPSRDGTASAFGTRKGELGYLHDLVKVHKHQGFTVQAPTLDRRLERGGLRIDAGPLESRRIQFAGQISSTGHLLDSRTSRPLTNTSPAFREVSYGGWEFTARPPRLPAVAVLPTLQTLYQLITGAVADIRHEAGV